MTDKELIQILQNELKKKNREIIKLKKYLQKFLNYIWGEENE